jgi:hypothetical protein
MDIRETELDFESMKEKALRQLRSGESLYGKDGAFAPLLKKFLEAALEAEMDGHLDEPERLRGNRRNGKQRKQLRTSDGTIELSTPRDRHSSVSTLWSTSMNNLMLFLALVDEQRRKKSPDVCYDSRLAAERPEQETLLRGKWHQ